MKKLFLCDIDGTIIDGSRDMKDVSEKTRYAISELSKDNYVFIASGRNKGLLDSRITSLNPNGYILCNGAYAEIGSEVITTNSFDNKIINKIIDSSLNNNGFYVLESLNNMYVNDLKAENFIKFLKGWGMSIQGFENLENTDNDFHIAMVGFPSEEDCLNMEKELNEIVDVRRHNGFKSYDLNIKGIDKGVASKKVMEYLNIDYENTYCFGDGINDLEMLLSVKHPVIMANCDARLRTYNFEETKDVLDDGFYHYLVSNKLIKPM